MFINVNGSIGKADEPVLTASNRGYRYGDGVFETMKVANGHILLRELHFQRLFSSLHVLQYSIPAFLTPDRFAHEILHLCILNECSRYARIRFSLSRGSGGLYDGDNKPEYIIECWPLNDSTRHLNENGLVIDICPGITKSHDQFSHIKSSNFLPYVMAAAYAREQKLNDCLLLNPYGRIADATIANLFILKDDVWITPPLTEACIDGVMRRHLLKAFKNAGIPALEQPVTMDDVEAATAVFLSNAVHGIRWVQSFRHAGFPREQAAEIFDSFVKTIEG